ncbi:MAG: galactose-1-phosphate uridylyltransferase [Candidatus Krumholzibacteria bacterium]|nr:galactose-1-phosphate uridylyltransferase [Candidatus Krumholzibacteria bacterium]
MSTLRQDPLTGRWVIMAASRGDRPNEFRLMQRDPDPGTHCPFCPGHESSTTPEILAIGRSSDAPANGTDWRMRVVPNRYPALRPGNESSSDAPESELPPEFFPSRSGVGSHEVIIYTPDHAAGLASLGESGLLELLKVLRDRSEVLSRRPGHKYISPFCNHGPEAGATLAHPHMQIIGTPELPSYVVDKAVRFADYRARTGGCLLCDLVAAEEKAGDRVICSNDRWTSLAPWASRFPWEMLLVPSGHRAYLTEADDDDLASLCEVLSFSLRGLASIHGDPSLNLVIHSAPLIPTNGEVFGDKRLDDLAYSPNKDFHWHLEIMPRLSRQAGFEVGTGFTINSVIPEEAARRLREEGS